MLTYSPTHLLTYSPTHPESTDSAPAELHLKCAAGTLWGNVPSDYRPDRRPGERLPERVRWNNSRRINDNMPNLTTAAPMTAKRLFPSLFLGGFECSSPLNAL